MIWFGNLNPGIVMIDAKPVPGTDKVVAIFSPGHGWREHAGPVILVDAKADRMHLPRPQDHRRSSLSRSMGFFRGLFHGRAGGNPGG